MKSEFALRSDAIKGKPIIYLADPFGKSFACVPSLRDYKREMGMNFRQIEVADMVEVRELHAKMGLTIPLADRLWWRVEAD